MKNSDSLSLYVHIPFCVSKCYYCDFYSASDKKELIDNYLQALVLEWNNISREKSCDSSQIDTIYFGGGTPSLLSSEQFSYLHDELISKLNLSDQYEWSIECNPDSFSENKAALYLEKGVNRLTFGIQSLINKELKFLGRPHSAEQALDVLHSPILAGFKSIGVDLMIGIPLQTKLSFEYSLKSILQISHVKHLSLYELTINECTPFGRHYNKLPLPSEDTVGEIVETGLKICTENGYDHYEISNFAKPSFHSRHNEAYWDHRNYIGIGPSAHSYFHPFRWSNISNTQTYITNLKNCSGTIDFKEEIDGAKLANEILFLGLRRSIGINEDYFKEITGRCFYDNNTRSILDSYLNNGYLIYESPFWRPTEKGMLYADAIARNLIL